MPIPLMGRLLPVPHERGLTLRTASRFGIKSFVLKNFLDANGIETLKASTSTISRTELGKKIDGGTLFLSCLMTYAQIEKLRAEKVMFSDLE